jgi:hypothetical protein
VNEQLTLSLDRTKHRHSLGKPLPEVLAEFCEFGQSTRQVPVQFSIGDGTSSCVTAYVNEFWTARQRQANSLHEVSYRACFKPQLPRFFIERLTKPGETVYDPFMGRGTTPIESALLGRIPYACDINPLSRILVAPRLHPPTLEQVEKRLASIDLSVEQDFPEELLVFFHRETLHAIVSLRKHLMDRRADGTQTREDEWITLLALNRLTGHSPGFFSVYTLPPNQAVSVKSQIKINAKRSQSPEAKDIRKIILKKSRQLLGDCSLEERRRLADADQHALWITGPADSTPQIPDGSVSLVVTSPPFLNVVDYATDNWLRCWFVGIDPKSVKLTVPSKLKDWELAMTRVFKEIRRVLRKGGHVAFEVGEVHGGKTLLEKSVLTCGTTAGLVPELVLINDQKFTKTANCWGVDNMSRGTNTNRIVLFRKD